MSVARRALIMAAIMGGCGDDRLARESMELRSWGAEIEDYRSDLFERGQEIFRDDTMGSEQFWGGKLRDQGVLDGVGQAGVVERALAVHLRVGDDQLSIPPPTPPAGSYSLEAAERGAELFGGVARCATCHVPPLFSEPGWAMHTGAEIGIDEFQALRSPDERYRTAPLRGLWARTKGGFYHDGRFADLGEVIDHYAPVLGFTLTAAERSDLIEYLKSI